MTAVTTTSADLVEGRATAGKGDARLHAHPGRDRREGCAGRRRRVLGARRAGGGGAAARRRAPRRASNRWSRSARISS